MIITVKPLLSGYTLVRGFGPCNFAQPATWPCDEETLRASAHPEASDEFIRAAIASVSAPTGEASRGE